MRCENGGWDWTIREAQRSERISNNSYGAPISSSERAGVSVIQQYTTHKWSLSKMTDMVLTDVDPTWWRQVEEE